MLNLKNIILLSKNGKQYNSRALLGSRCCYCSEFLCPSSYASPSSNSEPLVLLMMEGKSRADVTTLRRRDVSACWLLYWLTQRRDVGTSRRGDVATLERHDAPALSCIAFHCSNFLPNSALFTSFSPAFTEIAILRYWAIKTHI